MDGVAGRMDRPAPDTGEEAMKKDITYVAPSKLLDIVAELGLPLREQRGFHKVSPSAGRAIYIANTKAVGRVDLSGFTFEGAGVRDLGGESFCSVKQQVDFSRTEDEILATFRAVCEHLATLAPREKEKRAVTPKSPRPKKASKDETQAEPDTEDRKAAALAHLERVRKFAQMRGVPVSQETEARLLADAE